MAYFVAFCIGFQKNIPLQNPPGGGRGGGIWQLKVYHIFEFSAETTEQKLTKAYRKQLINVLCQVCDFRTGRKKDHRLGV